MGKARKHYERNEERKTDPVRSPSERQWKVDGLRHLACAGIIAIVCDARASQIEQRKVPTAVASAVGRVIVEYDRGVRFESASSGSLWTFDAFRDAYRTLRGRSEADRVEFLWAVMMHVPFSNDFERLFLEFVSKNSGRPFEARLQKFLADSALKGESGPQQRRVEHVLGHLVELQTPHPPTR